MGYHFSHSHKAPKTKKEKLEAARQYFVVALIGTAATFATIGWVYWHQKTQAERSKIQAERSKVNNELVRDLVRLQANNSSANNSPAKNLPEQQQPPAESYLSSDVLTLMLLPGVLGAVSFLMFYMAISLTVEARRMSDPPESRNADT